MNLKFGIQVCPENTRHSHFFMSNFFGDDRIEDIFHQTVLLHRKSALHCKYLRSNTSVFIIFAIKRPGSNEAKFHLSTSTITEVSLSEYR